MNIRYPARKAFPILSALALMIAASASAQSFLTSPFAVDNAGETGAPSVNPAVQTASVVFELPIGYFYRVIVDTNGAGGVGSPDGVFDRNDDWTWQGIADVQLVPAQVGGQDSLTLRVDWDGTSQWDSSALVGDGIYAVQVEIGFAAATVRDGNGVKEQVQIEIDTKAPAVSFTADSSFSPNADGQKDASQLAFASSEALDSIEISIASGPALNMPNAAFSAPYNKAGSASWDGTDITGASLPDGEYALQIRAADRAGNEAAAQQTIIIDTRKPAFSTFAPVNGALLNAPVAQIEAGLDALGGSPIDVDNLSIQVANAAGEPVAGALEIDPNGGSMRFVFASPLSTTAENGIYNVTASIMDEAGNSASRSSRFMLDTAAPLVGQASASGGLVIPGFIGLASDTLTVGIDETGSGIDFGSAQATLTAPSGALFPVAVDLSETSGGGQIELTYANLAEEGVYTMQVSGVSDRAGNAAAARSFSFIYDETAPRIVSLTPFDLRPGALTRANSPFDSVVMTLSDNLTDIDFSASGIAVRGPNGAALRGTLYNDGESTVSFQLETPLSALGADDGQYSVSVRAADAAGNAVSISSSLILDTQAPSVVSSSIGFDEELTSPINSVQLTLSDGNGVGIDLSASQISLSGPGGAIPLQKSFDGETLTLVFPEINANGSYTLSVQLSDEAGNTMSEAALTPFTVTLDGPAVVSLTINGAPPSAYVSSLTEARAQFADRGGVGLDFTDGGSSLAVAGPNGAVDSFIQEEGSGLIWRPTGIIDADGSYTVSASAVDKRGRTSATLSHTFILDTQAPSVVSSSLAFDEELTSPINSVQLTLSDGEGVGVDLPASAIALSGPGGSIPLQKSFDGETLTLVFPEINENGSYTLSVQLSDEAGNTMSEAALTPFTVTLDGPAVVSLTINGAPPSAYVSSLTEARAQFADRGGVGLDFTDGGSSLAVAGPNGAVDSFIQEEGSGLVWRPTGIIDADGSYTVSASAVDKRGRTSATLSHTFILDTQAPSVVSSSLAFDEELTSPINSVQLTLSDGEGVGVDLSASQISLSGPGGSIPLQKSFDGETLTLVFPEINANGSYTLSVQLSDEAGNAMSEAALTPFTVTLDGPAVVSLTINGAPPSAYVSSLTEARAQFADRGGVGLDFTDGGSSLAVTGPNGAVDGFIQEEGSGLVWRPTGIIDADGSYTVSASAVDKRGRTSATLSHTFILDTQAPSVVSSSLAFDEELTSPINSVQLTLSDGEGVGVDLSASQISLSGPGGSIPLQKSFNGRILTLVFPEINANGSYTLSVQLSDEAGNAMSEAALTPFTVTLDGPAVVSLTINGAPPSAYVSSLTEARAQFADRGGVGLDFTDGGSSLAVTGPNGAVDSFIQEEGSGLVWRPTGIIDADGSYTVSASAVDKRGRTSATLSHTFILDTQAPSVVSSSLAFDEELTSPINSVQLTLSDGEGVGVDLSASQISLSGPGGSIPLQKSFNGRILTLVFPEINENGSYTLSVQLSDEAGNTMSEAALTPFTVTLDGPAVVSLTINGAPPSAYVSSLTEARAQFADRGGVGLDFTDGGSSLAVAGPNGAVDGFIQEEGSGLIWRPTGIIGADGSYTVSASAVDKRGRASAALSHTFILDTQAPRILSMTPAANSMLTGGIEQIVLTLAPDAAGLDISATTAALLSPSGSVVPSSLRVDSDESLRLEFAPLRGDGTDDGTYRVVWNLADRAGNSVSETREFTLANRKPYLVLSEPADGTYVNRWSQFTAQLGDDSGSGINFDTLQISISSPDGQLAAGRASHDGAQTVAFTADASAPNNGSADGVYAVSIYVENRLGRASVIETSFTLDTTAPSILSVSLAHGAILDISYPLIASISVSDEGSGIDFDASTIQVIGPDETVLPALVQYDGSGIFTLKTDRLTSFGRYRIETTLRDRAGNVSAPTQTVFEIRQAQKIVTNVQPAHRSYVRSLSSVVAELSGATYDSTMELIGPNGEPVAGSDSFAFDRLTLTLETPLASDGRDDGDYTVRITPVYPGGVAGPTLQYSFTMDTQAPRISGLQPANVFSAGGYVSFELIEASVQISDAASGVNLSASSIRVINSAGANVRGVQTHDGVGGLVWTAAAPLPDGRYTLHVNAVDRAGLTASMRRPFALDTQAPSVVSSSIGFDEELTSPINSVQLTLSDGEGAGVDLSASQIALSGPGGSIPLQKSFDGETLTLVFPEINENGSYTLSVQLNDEAGNAMSEAALTPFTVTLDGPAVVSLTINGAPPSAYVSSLTEARAQFADRGGVGLDFTDGGSSLSINGPNGAVDGFIQEEGSGLIWRPTGIIDADGSYTVSASAVDKRGRTSATLSHTFILDTQAPSVVSSSLAFDEELTSPINSVQLTLSDGEGVGVDLSASQIALSGPGGSIPLQKSFDGETLTLVFPEINENGGYTLSVQLSDEAGNTMSEAALTPFTVTLDGPAVVSLTINGAPPSAYVSSLTEARAQFADRGGVGLDFTDGGSSLSINGPNGAVDGFIQEEGSGLVWRPTGIIDADGSYTVSASAVDKRGRTSATLSHAFILDTQAPSVVSSSLAFDEELTSPINSVQLTLSDGEGVGVDLSPSAIALSGPGGSIPLQKSFDGETLTLVFPEINANGSYTLSVQLSDEAGNTMSEAELTPFTMTLDGPVVVSVTVNRAAPSSYATSLTEVGAVFADRSGAGLDFSDGATRIQVNGPNGEVNGTLTQNGGALTWTPDVPIRENGLDDGTYAVSAAAVDLTGQTSPTESYTFILDTQAPRITSALPLELLTSLGYLNSPLSVISVTLADAASGVDLSASSIAVFDSDGAEVAGVRTDDGAGTIIWTAAEPFADDGSSDGVYVAQMTAADRAGHTFALARPFTLDTQHPTVASSSVAFDEELNAPINSIQLTLTDGEGVGVDLSASSFALSGPGGSVPLQKTEDGDSVELVFPALKTNGVYTLSALLADKAGNVMSEAALTPFTVRLSGPSVVGLSVNGAAPPPYASALTEARAEFEDRGGVGLDFTDAGSSLQVTGPRGGVSGVLTADGNALIWTPAIPLRTDGSDDGTYTVSASAVDMGGRASPALTHTFILDTQAPRVASSSPVDAALPTNYVSASFSVLEASVVDVGPAGLEAGAMTIRLMAPSGGEVPSEASYNENGIMRLQLNNPLPTNGSGDGVYTLEIEAVDRAGNALRMGSAVVYDTQPPALTASTPADGSVIDPTARQISLQLRDSVSGVDPAAAALTLTSPSGASIPGTTGVSIDGENSTVQFTFEKILTEVGDYLLSAELVDRAGNRRLIELRFYNASNTPTVLQTVPDTRLAETAYAEIGLSEVSALLREAPGSGISTAPGVSTIRLIDPQGNPVSGVQSSRSGNTLVLTLGRALRDDGSDDGTYQIEVTPANAAGIQGTTQTFAFVYDSQPPEILSSIGTYFPQSEFEQSGDAIAGFYVNVLDDTAGVDWENVDETWMSLENADGETVAGTVSGSSLLQTLQIVFLTPLASDGSEDGIYTLNIRALDKAGNEADVSYQFLVDLTAPAIDATSLTVNGLTIVTDANETGYPTSVNSETGVEIAVNVTDESAGVDLARSGIVVTAPDGSQVNGTLRQNNLDRLVFESGPLTGQGIYTVSVTAVGIDFSGLGVQPESVLGAAFLYEKTAPTAVVSSSPGNAIFESEPAHLTGTALDEPQQGGEGSPPAPASGVALVEIGGVGPDGEELEWEAAEDDSPDAQNPWAQWSSDFLPSRSGTYRVLVRVTDRAGNSAVVDAGMYEFTTALTFKGPVYVWPNPLSRSRGDTAHFSFETNQADRAEWRLTVYTVAGALVYRASGQAERERQANSQSATWNLRNGAGQAVASGLYVFMLEIDDGQSVFRKMGRMLVVK